MLSSNGRYFYANSRIHKLSSFSKIISTILFIIVTIINGNLYFQGALLLLLFIMMLMSDVPIRNYFKQLIVVAPFLIFLALFYFFFKISWYDYALIANKIILILIYTSLLIYTTTPTDMASGIEKFLSPLKVVGINVASFSMMIALSLRFIPRVFEQTIKLMKALATRGLDFHNSKLKDKIYILKKLMGPIFSDSFRSADNIANLMEVRLYNPKISKTNYKDKKWEALDYFIVGVHLLILVSLFLKGVIPRIDIL